jgi:aryl-alcohol dehydrogenase-like predicted oxidoreductase
MEYTKLGGTGLIVSKYCLGTMTMGSSSWKSWVLDERDARPLLKEAVDAGITFFDMANWYSVGENERVVSKALIELVPRDRLILATKTFYPMSDDPNDRGLSRKNILRSVDASLKRMGTEYVDLLIIHAFDTTTPIAETMAALDDVVRAGKVLYLGASTMFAWQFAEMNHVARENGWTSFVNMQCQYNLLYREEEREMIPYCHKNSIAVTAFSPLARGWLSNAKGSRSISDNYYRDFYGDPVDHEILAEVTRIAAQRNVSKSEVALAWVRQSPDICCPIIGVSRPEQLNQALQALSLTLDADERLRLDVLYRPRDVINDQVAKPRSRYTSSAR